MFIYFDAIEKFCLNTDYLIRITLGVGDNSDSIYFYEHTKLHSPIKYKFNNTEDAEKAYEKIRWAFSVFEGAVYI